MIFRVFYSGVVEKGVKPDLRGATGCCLFNLYIIFCSTGTMSVLSKHRGDSLVSWSGCIAEIKTKEMESHDPGFV